jgi:PDZ domain-containing secreted protein
MDMTYQQYDNALQNNSVNNCKQFSANKPVKFRYKNENGEINIDNISNNTYKTNQPSLELVNNTYYNPVGSKHVVSYTAQDITGNSTGLMRVQGYNY